MLRTVSILTLAGAVQIAIGCGGGARDQGSSALPEDSPLDASADVDDATAIVADARAGEDRCYQPAPGCCGAGYGPICSGGAWRCPYESAVAPPSGCSSEERCSLAAPCDPGWWCDQSKDRCFENGDAGTEQHGVCRPVAKECPLFALPTCGCDGQIYYNECLAQAAGVDASRIGSCGPAPYGRFPCGPYFCDSDTEYCYGRSSDIGWPTWWECLPSPAFCGSPIVDCACMSGTFDPESGGCTRFDKAG